MTWIKITVRSGSVGSAESFIYQGAFSKKNSAIQGKIARDSAGLGKFGNTVKVTRTNTPVVLNVPAGQYTLFLGAHQAFDNKMHTATAIVELTDGTPIDTFAHTYPRDLGKHKVINIPNVNNTEIPIIPETKTDTVDDDPLVTVRVVFNDNTSQVGKVKTSEVEILRSNNTVISVEIVPDDTPPEGRDVGGADPFAGGFDPVTLQGLPFRRRGNDKFYIFPDGTERKLISIELKEALQFTTQ